MNPIIIFSYKDLYTENTYQKYIYEVVKGISDINLTPDNIQACFTQTTSKLVFINQQLVVLY